MDIMVIEKVQFEKVVLKFRQRFTIAWESIDTADIVVVKIYDGLGNLGLGAAAPDHVVTGETVEKILSQFQLHLVPEFFDIPISEWYKYHEKIQSIFPNMPAAQTALEEAILNLFTLQNNISLTSIFGGYRNRCPIMISLGIKGLEETLSDIKLNIIKGFKLIKLKVGKDLEQDLKLFNSLSGISKNNNLIRFIIDVNCGYSYIEARQFFKSIEGLPIALVEQPVDIKDFDSLKKLHKEYKAIPIIADESVLSYNDAFVLMRDDIVSGVNIKLMKCGGPINFMKIFHLSKLFRKICMIGCCYESNISITTGASLALALPVDFVDLDSGYLDFDNDIVSGGATVDRGIISIERPLKYLGEKNSHKS